MKPNIVVLTADDGNIEAYAALTRENKRSYCERHGYTYLHYDTGESLDWTQVNAYWRLIWPILDTIKRMPDGDWLFFSGADACIVNSDITLSSIVDQYSHDYDLLITKDMNGLNNNGFLLRACDWSREFIERVWELRGQTFEVKGSDGQMHEWAEQGGMIAVLEQMPGHTLLIPQEVVNGYEPEIYGAYYKPPVFMAHFPGKPTDQRVYFIKRALGLKQRISLPEGYWIDTSDRVRDAQHLDHGPISTFKQ